MKTIRKMISEKNIRLLLDKGGCPANNTKCGHIDKQYNKCTLSNPDLWDYGNKYACGSFNHPELE